jgi:hypothetical protein
MKKSMPRLLSRATAREASRWGRRSRGFFPRRVILIDEAQ